MIVWVDAQLSPALAPWLTEEFGIEAYSARYLKLLHAQVPGIFQQAREANVAVMTKDVDLSCCRRGLVRLRPFSGCVAATHRMHT